MTDLKDSTTSLYRYFDATGFLIYVGITSCGVSRNRQHNSDKEWWPFVHSQEVEHFSSRRTALKFERSCIRTHQPPFNIQHNPYYESIRAAYLESAKSSVKPANIRRLEGVYEGKEKGMDVLSFVTPIHVPASCFSLPCTPEALAVFKGDNEHIGIVKQFVSRGLILRMLVKFINQEDMKLSASDRFVAFLKGHPNKKPKFVKRVVKVSE